MLPIGEFTITDEVEVIDEAELPTRTYKLDFKRGRCVGMTDKLDAMEQAIFKMMQTIRFEHLIYSDDYGFEGMTGKERIFVQAELPRRVKETLLQDGRITSIEDFSLEFEKDKAFASLTAITIYGDVNVLREVINFV
ncbi:DUF2634 domain-containing protein [Sporosarcina sp. FSL K6-2383]|uniref:DUF2634 domain-containing protein n=1 Tax=Sporosarcina sp. FSL K6-2383 TaxID=2921556 RepID=UPI003159D9DF